MDELDFNDLTPKEVIVKMGGKKFLLREASGDATAKYRNASLKAARMNDGKLVGMDGLFDCEPYLVSLCLYYADEQGQVKRDKHGNPLPDSLVSVGTVRSWSNRVQRRLFDWIDANSDLGKNDTEESLLKQQESINERLTRLKEASEGGDPTKSQQQPTEDGSSLPTD